MNHRHDIIRISNNLIVTTIDSALGCEESARDVANRRYEGSSGNSRVSAARLSVSYRRKCEAWRHSQTGRLVKSAAHSRWVNLKSTAAAKIDKAVIAEVNNREAYIRGKYKLALKDQKLSPETRFVIETGLGSVRAGQFFASRLEQALSSAPSGSSTRNARGLKAAGAVGLVGVDIPPIGCLVPADRHRSVVACSLGLRRKMTQAAMPGGVFKQVEVSTS